MVFSCYKMGRVIVLNVEMVNFFVYPIWWKCFENVKHLFCFSDFDIYV